MDFSVQYCFSHIVCFFFSVQYIKGQTVSYSVTFGLTWAFITIVIFATRRAYNLKRTSTASCVRLKPKRRAAKKGLLVVKG